MRQYPIPMPVRPSPPVPALASSSHEPNCRTEVPGDTAPARRIGADVDDVGAGGVVGAGAGGAGVFFTFFTAWPRLRPLSTISVFNWANGTFWFRDAFSAATNCPWLRNPALACSSVIPAGSMDVRRAFCCGLRDRRAEISFGSATGVVEAGGVVELPGSVPVVVPVPPADPLPLVDDVVVDGVEAAP